MELFPIAEDMLPGELSAEDEADWANVTECRWVAETPTFDVLVPVLLLLPLFMPRAAITSCKSLLTVDRSEDGKALVPRAFVKGLDTAALSR